MLIVRKLGLALLLISIAGCGGTGTSGISDPPGSYSTTFPGTETPISERGKWINGGVTGLDWTNVNTTPGKAVGTQGAIPFSDSTALLQNSPWGNDQSAQATVFVDQTIDGCGQEVELRLRSTIAAHSNTGYEILYGLSGYMAIVRWDGALGNFTILSNPVGPQFAPQTGDVVKATIVGNTITAYKNGQQVSQVTDSTYSAGSPGIGFNLTSDGGPGCPGTNANYGFSSFAASDSTHGSL